MAKKRQKKQKQNFLPFIKWFWILFGAGVLSVVLIFQLASWGVFGEMPTFERLENPSTNLATEFISSDGETLGKLYLNDNRTPVTYDGLPENLVNALVATEDARYFDHSGIDARGTLRAVAYLGSKGGASTISQQLSKLLFTQKPSGGIERIIQKIKEWVIATRLERQYTKEEIIAMYLNQYDFINNADGIRSAARIYFGKEPIDLRTEESAVLVGMLKNSSLYNPMRRKELVLNRRNTVLGQMAKYGYITEEEKDSLQALEMKINFNPESHREGLATYFRMYLQRWLNNWVKENPKPNGEEYNIYLDGLKVYTTVDSRMQRNAEEAVQEHMSNLQAEFFHQNTPQRNATAPFLDISRGAIDTIMRSAMKRSARWRHLKREGLSEKDIEATFQEKTEMTVFDWNSDSYEKDTIMTPMDSIRYYKTFLRTAMMSMEPQTGHVKAWVGGIDYKHFQYDNVIQGARQAGSLFKPFVYAAAIDQLRYSPCYTLPDNQYCIEAGKHGNMEMWCPHNSDGTYSGENLTLKSALANSVNSVTAQLIDRVGPGSVASIAKSMGVTKEIPPVPSIALGTPDVSVYEIVGAFGTYANQGVYVKPVMVTRIEDKNGTVLYEYKPETKDVLSKDVAYAMVNLLEGVTEYGSGGRLRHTFGKDQTVYKEIITGYPYELTNPIAGKTGTTQNQSDGWFMGMVPNLVTGVWVGGEDRSIHFERLAYGQGAAMALPIWALYMKKNYANEEIGVSKEAFEEPEEMSINIDCSKEQEDEEEEKIDTEDDLDDLDF
ncbi:MAG: transglycosylase domain-containing protein [Bacteroidota bacterium]|uniref:Transglycosylase domain-containing protein n=1 Tax=Flagellimonas profundi TaxID=2915620 RepID=A0ABS3FG60_9FLAO|nr:transglycosylase domain-containing protein [Allomuricauda profundi]MBO0342154.1 transglycosylase domain-containing protein [Allomuricauda profundi]MEC7769617.1 transglycosylase domain-containing protein [Bacteroidota bacterium]